MLGACFGVDNIPKQWIEAVRNAKPYLKCRNRARQKIPMDIFSLRDVDTLVPKLMNINI